MCEHQSTRISSPKWFFGQVVRAGCLSYVTRPRDVSKFVQVVLFPRSASATLMYRREASTALLKINTRRLVKDQRCGDKNGLDFSSRLTEKTYIHCESNLTFFHKIIIPNDEFRPVERAPSACYH
jgi:hypothetical protein